MLNCVLFDRVYFCRFRYLTKLNLADNRFVHVPAPLGGAVALEYLRLDNNPIEVIDRANGFPNLTKLKEVSLCYMQSLTAIENGGLSALINLENLYVQNCPKLNRINDYAMAQEVHRSETLTDLTMSRNNRTEITI